MNTRTTSKGSRISRVLMTALTILLIFLFLDIMSLVADIQGTARVVNYAGLVRGTTQRIVKMEDAGLAQDKMIESVNSYIDGLRYGSDDLDLVRLDDEAYQAKMTELADRFAGLRTEIELVRETGYQDTDIIAKSEDFFELCNQTTGLAEEYSQEKATALDRLESIVIADIVGLLALFAIELVRALHTAALNRQLQRKVYLDEATGLLNKNKCEEILSQPGPIGPESPLAVFVFDLNNLRTINNNLGHEKGDEYIRSFALQLAKVQSPLCFTGRYGGDEFLAVLRNADAEQATALLDQVRRNADEYSQAHPDMPISYAAGYALSSEFESPTMRELFRQADKNMYIDKNNAKIAEAAARQRQNERILKRVSSLGFHFSNCIYCDAELDQYRILRASSNTFLADSGNYSGAVERIACSLTCEEQRPEVRRALQLETLRERLTPQSEPIELILQSPAWRGRITVLHLDDSKEGALHHFVVALEPFSDGSASEKQQLSRYYDQLRQSILENGGGYVDALLDSAQAAYSVDLTNDRLEQVFFAADGGFADPDMQLPCSYTAFCREHVGSVTESTLESYRLADSSEKLLARFKGGANEVTIEFCETRSDGKPQWSQKVVLMSQDSQYRSDIQDELPVVRGIVLIKNTSAFHEREQAEKHRLEQALQTADSESKAKTEFMNRMSHDFRTPINGILGMLDIIGASEQDPAKTRQCLDKIQISANHLLDLVNDVLDMSKLGSGQAVLEQDEFDLLELADDVESLVAAQILESGISHERFSKNVKHSQLIGSDLRLRQIMLNLFSNAIKYNKPGGKVDTYITELSCNGYTALFEFKIADTGIGMSEEFVSEHLFKPFTQEQNGARTRYQGTGLGMSIVKTLIDAMGGTISVQSTPDVGTEITFTLPFKINGNVAAKPECAQAAPQAESSLSGKRVLLVEDNDLNMEIAEFYLDHAGAAVVKAWNGKEAVRMFTSSKPGTISLILMDLMMPVMDGYEATRAIRALDHPDASTVPIIAMTANAFDEDRKKSKAAGMNAHLAKPLDMQALLSAAGRFCR
ncbi:ATP-binding protein [Senegalimassilia anaerobia]|uniref:ATP-binding protein n=1 Tax=Senegalimassilia anaerobia TaxID=1473216 RepID=UPI0026751CE1|nr:ATP-binding protein [Senegalimassilia anaerobia]